MNWLGKLFVVAILVMSIVFGGFAVLVYSTHKDWKGVATRPRAEATPLAPAGLKFQLEDEQAKRSQLEEQLQKLTDELAAEKTARIDQVGKLQSANTLLKDEYTRQANINADLVQKGRLADEAMLTTHNTLENMRKEVETLRTAIHAAQQDRDNQFTQVVGLTDQLNQVQSLLNTAKSQNMELGEQVARFKMVLDRHGVSPNASVDDVPPQVDGVVLASSRDGLVEISLGSDDGIERGHKLEVYRGAKYLGRIEVSKTAPDKSVARILPEFRKGPIAKEDRVATRLD